MSVRFRLPVVVAINIVKLENNENSNDYYVQYNVPLREGNKFQI